MLIKHGSSPFLKIFFRQLNRIEKEDLCLTFNSLPYKFKWEEPIVEMPNEKIKVWNINRYCLDEKILSEILTKLENSIDIGEWYIHFYSDLGNKLYVIFKGKHFLISKKKDSTWDEMIRFGESVGVARRWTETIPVSFQL